MTKTTKLEKAKGAHRASLGADIGDLAPWGPTVVGASARMPRWARWVSAASLIDTFRASSSRHFFVFVLKET